MQFDRRLIDMLGAAKPVLGLIGVSGLFTAIAIIGQAAILSHVINRVFLAADQLSAVLPTIGGFAAFSILLALSQWLTSLGSTKLAATVKITLRRNLSVHIAKLGPSYLKNERSGEIGNTLAAGVEALDPYFSLFLPQLFLAGLIPAIILLFVFPLDILSGFVFLLTAPLIPLFMKLIGSVASRLNQNQWTALSRMSAHFLDVLQGLTTLKLFGRDKDQIMTISKISNNFRAATMNVLRVAFLSALVLEIVATISIAIIAVEIGLRLLYDMMPFDRAFFILLVAPEFYAPIRQLGARYHAGMEGVTAAQRIFEILEIPVSNPSPHQGRINTGSVAPISFRDVSYTYQNRTSPALRGISMELAPQSTTALVGTSGSGKTTISQLLLRFINPDNGAIFVQNQDLQAIEADFWRRQIAWVPQKPYLFHGSIAENIRLADPQASDNQVAEAAERANIHMFINSLPDGYNTHIGERGSRLSGGQAQRVALARAFLKDAPILIMDEPTANIDPLLETELITAMRQLMKNRTVLIIAHRLNTVYQADQIVVLEAGRIIESGRHKELVKQKGHYANFISISGSGE